MKLAFWRYFRKSASRHKVSADSKVNADMIGPAFEMVPMAARTYNQDGLACIHSTEFAREPAFAAAYQEALKSDSWGGGNIQWRAHVICWAARQSLSVAGDYVECGTNRGGTAMLMIQYLGKAMESRTLHLFDTFSGLDSTVSTSDEMTRLAGHYTDCYEEVVERFRPFHHVKVIRGTVPDVLHANSPQQIAFLHVDLNAAAPERAAMEFLWARLSPGALVVFDDYAWVACREQKKALDEFASQRGLPILSLPTGQGLLIRPG